MYVSEKSSYKAGAPNARAPTTNMKNKTKSAPKYIFRFMVCLLINEPILRLNLSHATMPLVDPISDANKAPPKNQ
jgi:hypothetical protein